MSKFKVGQRVFIVDTDSDEGSLEGRGEKPEAQKGKWGTILFVEDNAYDLPYQVLTEDHKSAHWYEEEWLQSEEEFELEATLKNLNFGIGDAVKAVYKQDGTNYILIVNRIDGRGVWAGCGTGFFPFNGYTFIKVTRGYWAVG